MISAEKLLKLKKRAERAERKYREEQQRLHMIDVAEEEAYRKTDEYLVEEAWYEKHHAACDAAEEEAWEFEEENDSKWRCIERSRLLKEDLIAECFKPVRIEKWLEIGGHELLEAMME